MNLISETLKLLVEKYASQFNTVHLEGVKSLQGVLQLQEGINKGDKVTTYMGLDQGVRQERQERLDEGNQINAQERFMANVYDNMTSPGAHLYSLASPNSHPIVTPLVVLSKLLYDTSKLENLDDKKERIILTEATIDKVDHLMQKDGIIDKIAIEKILDTMIKGKLLTEKKSDFDPLSTPDKSDIELQNSEQKLSYLLERLYTESIEELTKHKSISTGLDQREDITKRDKEVLNEINSKIDKQLKSLKEGAKQIVDIRTVGQNPKAFTFSNKFMLEMLGIIVTAEKIVALTEESLKTMLDKAEKSLATREKRKTFSKEEIFRKMFSTENTQSLSDIKEKFPSFAPKSFLDKTSEFLDPTNTKDISDYFINFKKLANSMFSAEAYNKNFDQDVDKDKVLEKLNSNHDKGHNGNKGHKGEEDKLQESTVKTNPDDKSHVEKLKRGNSAQDLKKDKLEGHVEKLKRSNSVQDLDSKNRW